MSERSGPRRSARIASIARKQTRGEERKPKRMKKSDPPSHASTSVDLFDERLRDVFSFRAAIPLVSGVYDMLLYCQYEAPDIDDGCIAVD